MLVGLLMSECISSTVKLRDHRSTMVGQNMGVPWYRRKREERSSESASGGWERHKGEDQGEERRSKKKQKKRLNASASLILSQPATRNSTAAIALT